MVIRAHYLAKFLRNRRQEMGFSQNDLAFKIGLSVERKGYQQISNTERGTVQMPAKYIPVLAKELKVDQEFIIGLMVQDYRHSLVKEIENG